MKSNANASMSNAEFAGHWLLGFVSLVLQIFGGYTAFCYISPGGQVQWGIVTILGVLCALYLFAGLGIMLLDVWEFTVGARRENRPPDLLLMRDITGDLFAIEQITFLLLVFVLGTIIFSVLGVLEKRKVA